MILTDLPYGTTSNAWDAVIPMDQFWTAWKHICKPGSLILKFATSGLDPTRRWHNEMNRNETCCGSYVALTLFRIFMASATCPLLKCVYLALIAIVL
jgi:hypothetical protein